MNKDLKIQIAYSRIQIAYSILKIIQDEGIKSRDYDERFDVEPVYIEFLKDSKDMLKIPAGAWEKLEKVAQTINQTKSAPEPIENTSDNLPDIIGPADDHPAIAKAVLGMIDIEGITQGKAARRFGFHANYITILKNKSGCKKIPEKAWRIMREWVNSRKTITKKVLNEKLIEPAKPISTMKEKKAPETKQGGPMLDVDKMGGKKKPEVSGFKVSPERVKSLRDAVNGHHPRYTSAPVPVPVEIRIHPGDVQAFVDLAKAILKDIKITISISN